MCADAAGRGASGTATVSKDGDSCDTCDGCSATGKLTRRASAHGLLCVVPVTILTGYLGSGKTTFVNYLLNEDHGHKFAIIENEFGEVGIDDALVLQSNEEVIEMMNGCICCTVREDLIVTIKKLLETHKGKFNHIIIETTGLADPAPVAQTFFVDSDMKMLCRLVLCVSVFSELVAAQ